jgi:A/G-specific adenine glycosylase
LILTSEVMLQQTQAARVVGPFERWSTTFPTARACARGGPAAALRAWEGLGFNRRAINLQRAATEIVARHGGEVPSDLPSLQALSGVGGYTARAVMAFAFDADVGVVDVNVRRVLARAVADRPLRLGEAQTLADSLVPAGSAWAYNQAMFDIGALHCRARDPKCEGCPLRTSCAWVARDRQLPDPGARQTAPQSRFPGSDREGRGRLIAALRSAPVHHGEMAIVMGWSDQPERAELVVSGLVADGLVVAEPGGLLRLP